MSIRPTKFLWYVILGAIALMLVAHEARSDEGLVIGCSQSVTTPTQCGNNYIWRKGAPGVSVLVANNATTIDYYAGTYRIWETILPTERVWRCSLDIPVNSQATCASNEGFVLRSTFPPDVPPPATYTPQFNSFEVTPRVVTAGGEVLIQWTTQDMAGCSASWRTNPPPVNGTDRVNVATETVLQMSCTGLGGSSHIVGHRIKVQIPVARKPIQCVPYRENASELYSLPVSNGETVYEWGCDMPDGYQWVTRVLDPSTIRTDRLACLNPAWLAALTVDNARSADAACTVFALSTPAEGVANALQTRWKARFSVQSGTGIIRRPVYVQNPDGTRGAQLRIGNVLQYVLVGVPCDGRSRLLGISTRYHSVSGQTSQQVQTLPPGSFAQCSITLPPTGGFTN